MSRLIVGFIAIAVGGLLSLSHSVAQDNANDGKSVEDWRNDPVCQEVFFAVLEGLYRDNVSLEIVESIIGPPAVKDNEVSLKKRIQRSFVVGCPLCEPTFHAFLAYQSHRIQAKSFAFSGGKTNISAEQAKPLLSDRNLIRLMAMKNLIGGWLTRKFADSNLEPEQIARWSKRAKMRADEGIQLLGNLIEQDPSYQDWSTYFGCAACKAVSGSANHWNNPKDNQ